MSVETEPCEPPRLGTLEAQVMDILWDLGPSSVREVIDALPHDPAYTTIATVLANLRSKCLVTPCRDGRTSRCQARVTREEYVAALMGHALESSRDRTVAMMQFLQRMSEDDRAVMRRVMDEVHHGHTAVEPRAKVAWQ